MNPPSPLKYPNRDGLPLSQLSPERVNGRVAKMDDLIKASPRSSPTRRRDDTTFVAPGFPQSPSLPEISMFKDHIRMATDVSGLVKRFEHLDVRDRDAESLERKRRHEEALERAKIAREEAEAELAKCREELRAQKKDYEESKSRERKACRRIEILMDETTRAKDQWSSQSSVYEKEIRRARKEAFKSSSAVLKMQEEAKHSQNECVVLRSKVDMADRKVLKSEEEKFNAQYQLVAVQEELEKLRSTLRIAEEERERWKRSLQEEDILRIASQGSIALPDQTHDDIEEQDTVVLPIKASDEYDVAIEKLSLGDIRDQMLAEKRHRIAAESLADFLQLECRFRCCRCISQQGLRVGLHQQADSAMVDVEEQQERSFEHGVSSIRSPLQAPDAEHRTQLGMDNMDQRQQETTSFDPSALSIHSQHKPSDIMASGDGEQVNQAEDAALSTNVRQTRLSRHILAKSPAQSAILATPRPVSTSIILVKQAGKIADNDEVAAEEISDDDGCAEPMTPEQETQPTTDLGSWREVSKTTKVPMHFTPSVKANARQDAMLEQETTEEEKTQHEPKSYPFDREAALAAIAYRRGRAKSFAQSNGTPKKPAIERVTDRRDISAPAVTG